MPNDKILIAALSQIGIKEVAGNQDNPEVVKYFDRMGFGSLHDETAWCSAFMNWVAYEANVERSGKLNAQSWLDVGIVIETPELSDIVIYWREDPKSWKGHVGIFIREQSGWIYTLGGNQNDQVCIMAYPKNRVKGYRRLRQL